MPRFVFNVTKQGVIKTIVVEAENVILALNRVLLSEGEDAEIDLEYVEGGEDE